MSTTTTPQDNRKSWNTTLNYIVGKKVAEQALGFLTAAGEGITAAGTLDEAVTGALASATPFLADRVSVTLPGPGIEHTVSSRGATADYRALDDGLAACDAPLVLSVAAGTDRPDDRTAALLPPAGQAQVGAVAVLPLTTNGHTVGRLTALRVAARRDPEFDAATLRLLADLAGRLALAGVAFTGRPAGEGTG